MLYILNMLSMLLPARTFPDRGHIVTINTVARIQKLSDCTQNNPYLVEKFANAAT